jgi:hypothetical protein
MLIRHLGLVHGPRRGVCWVSWGRSPIPTILSRSSIRVAPPGSHLAISAGVSTNQALKRAAQRLSETSPEPADGPSGGLDTHALPPRKFSR